MSGEVEVDEGRILLASEEVFRRVKKHSTLARGAKALGVPLIQTSFRPGTYFEQLHTTFGVLKAHVKLEGVCSSGAHYVGVVMSVWNKISIRPENHVTVGTPVVMEVVLSLN
jgi:hypothetical protein